jgi:Dolichyl-phosphate-mannose-protein mannosyltransferase
MTKDTRETNIRWEFGRLAAVLRGLVLVGSVFYIALYAILVCFRLRYPFELEWLEGASVDHVRMILAGKPLYAKPSLEFIPLTYTPGYFYLAAAFSRIIGVGFLPLRLISVVSSVGLLAVTARLASRETGDAHAGILAAGLFGAMFGWTDGWLDLARTDSLFLLLAMLAVYVLRWHSSTRAMIAAGVLMSLSFLTKQTGLIIAVPLAAWCAFQGWRAFISFAGTVFVIVMGTSLVLERVFDGWYLYYVFGVPSQHPVAIQSIVGFWRYDFVGPMPVAVAVSCVYLVWRMLLVERRIAVFYTLAGAGFVGGAYVSRLHSLSFINVVLPAYLVAALVFAIAVHDCVRRVAGRWTPGSQRRLILALYGLCLLQLIRVGYWPQSFVPSAQDLNAGRLLVHHIAEMPGSVFVVDHGYLPALAGKDMHAHAAVIADVIRGGRTDVEKGLADALAEALRTHQFDSVIVSESPSPVREWLPIDKYYRREQRVVTVQSRFWRPEIRYVPR